MPPTIDELIIGDPPDAWSAAGFTVDPADGGSCIVGTTRLRFADDGTRGLLAWRLRGIDCRHDLDGLATTVAPGDTAIGDTPPHPNGCVSVDHVVVMSPDLDRTADALASAGLDLRRTRDAGGGDRPIRQLFYRLGEVVLEVVGSPTATGDGPAKFWGLAFTVDDLDEAARLLGDRLGQVKPAVQPGRQIATVRHRELGMSIPTAFMSPAPR